MRSTRYHNVYLDGAVCFWTSGVVERMPVFRSKAAARLVVSVLDECRKRCGVKLLGYVVMPDHIHLAIWAGRAEDVRRFIRQFLGIASARLAAMAEQVAGGGDPVAARWLAVFKRRARDGDAVRVWKERGRAFPITREDALREKLDYMHQNPVRAGLVPQPEDWEFSSASWYTSRTGPIPLDEFEW